MKKFILLAALAAFGGRAFAGGKDTYPHYEGEVATGYAVGVSESYINLDRFVFETVHGVRINEYVFAGAGVGLNIFTGFEDLAIPVILPAFVNAKGYYPVSDKFSVYASLDLGAAVGIVDAEGTNFYTSVGPGLQVGGKTAFDFSIRYQHLGSGTGAMLFRIGVRF